MKHSSWYSVAPVLLMFCTSCGGSREVVACAVADPEADAVAADQPTQPPVLGELAALQREAAVLKARQELEQEARRFFSVDAAVATAALVKLGAMGIADTPHTNAMLSQALAGLQQLAGERPSAQCYADLGRQQFRLGRFAEAERSFTRFEELAIEVTSLSVELFCWRGAAAQLLGGASNPWVARAQAAQVQWAAAQAEAERQRMQVTVRPTSVGTGGYGQVPGQGTPYQTWGTPTQRQGDSESMRRRQQQQVMEEQQRRQRQIDSFYDSKLRKLGAR